MVRKFTPSKILCGTEDKMPFAYDLYGYERKNNPNSVKSPLCIQLINRGNKYALGIYYGKTDGYFDDDRQYHYGQEKLLRITQWYNSISFVLDNTSWKNEDFECPLENIFIVDAYEKHADNSNNQIHFMTIENYGKIKSMSEEDISSMVDSNPDFFKVNHHEVKGDPHEYKTWKTQNDEWYLYSSRVIYNHDFEVVKNNIIVCHDYMVTTHYIKVEDVDTAYYYMIDKDTLQPVKNFGIEDQQEFSYNYDTGIIIAHKYTGNIKLVIYSISKRDDRIITKLLEVPNDMLSKFRIYSIYDLYNIQLKEKTTNDMYYLDKYLFIK